MVDAEDSVEVVVGFAIAFAGSMYAGVVTITS